MRKIIPLKTAPALIPRAAAWFSEKWGIPVSAYRESMESAVHSAGGVPSWYVIMDGEAIIAGLGVIENDFHERVDLAPNICAVYVEEAYRNRGIAGEMLRHVCEEFEKKDVEALYLVTEHEGFYERYGFEFYCMAKETGCDHMTRLYRRLLKGEGPPC